MLVQCCDANEEGSSNAIRTFQTLRISTDKTAIASKAPELAKVADVVNKSWGD